MKSKSDLSIIELILMSLAKTGISITVIVFSSFLNAELTFNGWKPDLIALILGGTAIFELIRFIFARLSDKNNKSKPYYLIGLLLGFIGILLIPMFIHPADNIFMLIPMILFYMGSAIMATLIDSHMTAISTDENRSNIATAIQITRLSGYAIGGIFGSRLYSTRGKENELNFAGDFFTSFTYIILVVFLITALITYFKMDDQKRIIDTSSVKFDLQSILEDATSKPSIYMLIFLFLYPIGLFMQDQILEPYAIIRLGFMADGVGRLVMIWASLTLIFAPIGNIISKRINKLLSLIIGQIIGSIGLITISMAGYLLNINVLYLGVTLFGIGSGLFAVPGVTYMLDIVAMHRRNLSMLISIFGMMTTIARSLAAIISATILNLSEQNFELVFIIEAVFFILSIFPILKLEKIIKKE